MKYDSDKKTAQYIRSGHQTSATTDINPGVNMQRKKHTRKPHLKCLGKYFSFVLQENNRKYYEGRDIHN
jgi:hypothetical protein